ncbi:FAD-binding oxidoreductase [Lacisediminimonas profundi]|uniref:FAD-binding oxidoreductase n=1 Tax=Lacisediminimonas profundi TaxID=2603856 RepID=UPI00124B7E06|nr:FAD-linked oxidase C-terminal domain-containing protein [Lacisediminimonas profundi]
MDLYTRHDRRAVPDEAMQALSSTFGSRFNTSMAVREHHGKDESPYPACPPDAVVFAESVEDVIEAVRICSQYKVPLVPFGIGSSMEGHIHPVQGGITLDMSGMNKVLAVNAEDFTVTVQPGVLRLQLNDEIRDTGLFFPIDPGANASLGGMAATRASGTNAVKYGTMRENVVSLKVVTADGSLIRTSSRARKSSSGYDLTRLYVGSEGTLGIIVEVTVRVYPLPEAVSAAICNFPTLQSAVDSVIQIMQAGVPVARVEFMDDRAVRAVNSYSKLTLKETPLLLFEFHGSPAAVEEHAQLAQEITKDNGGMDFEWAVNPEDRSRLWTARHKGYYAGLQMRPGARSVSTDVCVPISRLADCVTQTVTDLEQMLFPFKIVGHVGDGNFHVQMLLDPDSQDEWAKSEEINRRLVLRAIRMDGTCSGEHGVGIHKMAFLKDEHGEKALEVMRKIKHALDPDNIFNPGKMVSWD